MLIGIEYEMLIQLLAMAFGIPIIAFVVWWLFFVPKPAKAYAWAKLMRQVIDIEINDLGSLKFKRGKVEGAGIFRAKNDEVEFSPRNPEPWVGKRFSADKVATVFSYSGKAVCVSPETLAVLQANLNLYGDKLLNKKGKIDLSLLPENVKESLESQFLNVQATKDGKVEMASSGKMKGKHMKRTKAILLDPRILKYYVSKMISPAQIQYMQKKAYEKGYKEGQAPLFARLIPILIVMAMIFLGLVMFFGMSPA